MSPVSDSLNAWLDFTTRTSNPFPFDVSDLAEHVVPDVDLVRALGKIVLRAKTDPAVLDRMAQVVGWGDATSRLRRSRRPGVRRGDFGEALACEALEVFESFSVPVRKLRYQMDPEQTLHGTDIVAFKLNGHDRVQDLHFVECKLRTFRNLPAGVEAHQQLVDDRAGGYADTLMFLADRLSETSRPLYDAFVDYLADRARPERGSRGIVLVWDIDEWDEDVLVRVAEIEELLDPLHVRVLQAAHLAALVEQVYDSLGADVIDDGS